MQIIGLLITVACIAGLAVIYEGALDGSRRLRRLVRVRKASPSRGREDRPKEAQDDDGDS